MSRRFVVSNRIGSAAELHGAEPTSGVPASATWLEVDRPALVLGSTQPLEQIDVGACARDGIDIVRRRSGGAAVLVVPGEMLWLDVVIPAGDRLWHEDVGRSMWWLGDVWREALESCGVVGAAVHRGPVIHTTWSRLACFDGLGAGEVTIAGTKAVGISQRRTRSWARLQSAMHLVWRGEQLAGLFAPPHPATAEMAEPVRIAVEVERLRTAVGNSLQQR